MDIVGRTVETAIARWVEKGLVTELEAKGLQAEVQEERRRQARRLGQFVVAGLGAFALVAAAVLFADRSWENLTVEVRTLVLIASGGVGYLLGVVLFRRMKLAYSGALLQFAGAALLLVGLIYSDNAWDTGSAGAVAIGFVALITPLLLAPSAWRQSELTTALHAALVLPFWATAVTRFVDWDMEQVLWVLDGAIVLLFVAQISGIRRWSGDRRNRALAAFVITAWSGLVLAGLTAVETVRLDESAFYWLDAWMLGMAAVNLWGIHAAPPALQRDWYPGHLALVIAVLGIFAMFTGSVTWDLDAAGAWGGGAVVGAAGIFWGLTFAVPTVLIVGSLVLLIGTWIFAIDSAGALGAVLSLLASAVVLFWLSSRIRSERVAGSRATPAAGAEDSEGGSG